MCIRDSLSPLRVRGARPRRASRMLRFCKASKCLRMHSRTQSTVRFILRGTRPSAFSVFASAKPLSLAVPR
eukprot:13564931-Alexandrium_andersonii.AAC.1